MKHVNNKINKKLTLQFLIYIFFKELVFIYRDFVFKDQVSQLIIITSERTEEVKGEVK